MPAENEKPNGGRVQYKPTITFGNLLSMAMMMATLVGLYITHETRITRLESSMQHQIEQSSATLALVNKIADNQVISTRSTDRLAFILEEKFSKKP